jgi:hypothetical protein
MLRSIHILTLCLLALFLFSSPAEQTELETLFGPEVFVRNTGAPITEIRNISAAGFHAPFYLHLRNGDDDEKNRVSSAEVWLNDQLIFNQSDFSQKVAGYDIQIFLKRHNSLKVRLASKPGSKLKIWIEAIPLIINLSPVLDPYGSASSLINPEQGGRIETTDANGIHYILDIPQKAFINPQAEQISITPILSIPGLPFSGKYLAGLEFGPNGLHFFKPITLTIQLLYPEKASDLAAFTFSGNGADFSLLPFNMNSNVITLQLTHFSSAGVSQGTVADPAFNANPSSMEEWAKQEISEILKEAGNDVENLTESDRLEIINIMLTWYGGSVEPNFRPPDIAT